MRKAYGPTGVSFGYPFETFERQARDGILEALFIIGDAMFKATVDLSATGMHVASLRDYYNEADHMQIDSNGARVIVFDLRKKG